MVTRQDRKFRVAEIFGPTIQGEGALIGTQTHFIRLGGCDYRCSWCDSMHSVDPEKVAALPQRTEREILLEVVSLPGTPEWVTLSGGNPALFDLSGLVRLLTGRFKVAVETQGTIYKPWLRLCNLVTVSPKPPSSGNMTHDRIVGEFFSHFPIQDTPNTCLKVVVFDDKDFEYAANIFSRFPWVPCWVQVGNPIVGSGIKPDVTDLLSRLKWLSEKVLADERMYGAKVTPQLHTLIWGNELGH
ncbi:MAG TPA: 7-carboxy-7-deazaguanine synthase QueE [Ktedonobacteraceae bacterium]